MMILMTRKKSLPLPQQRTVILRKTPMASREKNGVVAVVVDGAGVVVDAKNRAKLGTLVMKQMKLLLAVTSMMT